MDRQLPSSSFPPLLSSCLRPSFISGSLLIASPLRRSSPQRASSWWPRSSSSSPPSLARVSLLLAKNILTDFICAKEWWMCSEIASCNIYLSRRVIDSICTVFVKWSARVSNLFLPFPSALCLQCHICTSAESTMCGDPFVYEETGQPKTRYYLSETIPMPTIYGRFERRYFCLGSSSRTATLEWARLPRRARSTSTAGRSTRTVCKNKNIFLV